MALNSTRLLASFLGALGVILWATETTLITFTTALPPLQTVALAFMFASLLSPLVWWSTGTHPLAAFKQPPIVWAVTVVALVGYHACIYYATQKAPPAPAAQPVEAPGRWPVAAPAPTDTPHLHGRRFAGRSNH